ncbi:MAG: transposase [Verrucomicrobia bacterium]|nr:transposase [Verrucomicrobiota bacterium]
MVPLAEIFRRQGDAYRARFAARMSRDQLRAMRAIERCRTKALGGSLWSCPHCGRKRYSYHSCRNRHCPSCGHEEAAAWQERQERLLVPAAYHLVTCTVPEPLRAVVRSHPRECLPLLMRASAQALLKLAGDRRHVGGVPGITAILHTWSRALIYHPHVHLLVTGGGLDGSGTWHAARPGFLVPVRALSPIVRAKVRDGLRGKHPEIFATVPPSVWTTPWVVHSKPVGSGRPALVYLSRYVYRVALSNRNILRLENGLVTFRWRDSQSGRWRRMTVPAEEFIRRFLQHVLPSRLVKVRHFGLHHPANRHRLDLARARIAEATGLPVSPRPAPVVRRRQPQRCPDCGTVLALQGLRRPGLPFLPCASARGPPPPA